MTIVSTVKGEIRGDDAGGVLRFRGIPFAAPPVGPLRFAPPEPPQPWTDVRDAMSFGPSAPQGGGQAGALFGAIDAGATSEDCLYLNVWTPTADDGRRPVMVWIHGGAFVFGSGSQGWYDGTALARRGDVVVVTINYRLGALGFTHLADAAGSGNAGILDQVAALQWVRDNIANFGGDPANVTIFGESAGAMSVGTLLGLPRARGLFRRAILQSGAAHNASTPAEASEVASAVLRGLELPPDSSDGAAALRGLPVDKILAVQEALMGSLGEAAGSGHIPFQPVADGDIMPQPSIEAIRDGLSAGVDVLVGTNRDEFKIFAMLAPPVSDEALLVERLDKLQEGGSKLIDVYRAARTARGHAADPAEIWSAILTDRVFRIPAVRLAEAQSAHGKVFSYLFTWASPAAGGMLGSCHALEIPFVFGTFEDPMMKMLAGESADAPALCERFQDAWIAFARTGDPNHPGLPSWPVYDTSRRATMRLDVECAVEDDPMADERKAWQGAL